MTMEKAAVDVLLRISAAIDRLDGSLDLGKDAQFCVMSRDQIIGMRKLEQWPNNGGLVMLPRAAI
jgi:hypothetical protein